MRKYFIDNIRWVTVILVLIYHVFYNFNASGAFGGVGPFTSVQYQDGYLYVVYPWFMVLLFLVAGIGSRYAIDKTTNRTFIHNRTLKLLVPSTIGLFVLQWVLGYLNVNASGVATEELAKTPMFVRYFLYVVSGVGPLWFIQDLWLYSLLIVVCKSIFPGRRFADLFNESHPKRAILSLSLSLIVGFFLLWGASQAQIDEPTAAQGLYNLYRPLFYFVPFLMGYYLFSIESVHRLLARMAWPLLLLAVIGAGFYLFRYFGSDYTSPACLQSLFTNLYAWVVILAIFGCFKRWGDHTSPVASYMTKSSFGIYIVHMLVCTASCLFFKATSLPVWSIYLLAILSTLSLSPLLYELLRRIPVIRWCVFGMKRGK